MPSYPFTERKLALFYTQLFRERLYGSPVYAFYIFTAFSSWHAVAEHSK